MLRAEIRRRVWSDPRYFIGYGFGTGLLPKMPGTWGTLIAIPAYLLLAKFHFTLYLLFVLLFGLYAASLSEALSKEIGLHDDPGMNIDEVVGYLITMMAAPFSWWAIVLGFGYFRLFDILKPWPISWVDQNVKGGFGMILDDVIAGVAAMLSLKLTFWIGALILLKI